MSVRLTGASFTLAGLVLGTLACSSTGATDEGVARTGAALRSHPAPRAKVSRVETRGDVIEPRTGHQVVAVRDKIYVERGHRDDIATRHNTFYRDLYRLDPQDRERAVILEQDERGDDTPGEMAFHCTVGDSRGAGALYLFGGAHFVYQLDPAFFQSLKVFGTLFRFDVAARRWSAIEPAPGPRPAPRAGCNAELHQGSIYLFGGLNRFLRLNNELWRYDIEANAWTRLVPNGPVPEPRFIGATVVDHDEARIYLYNGHRSTPFGFESIGDFWVYDIASNTFRELPPIPSVARDEGALSLLRAPGGKKYLVYTAGHTEAAVRCVGFPEQNTAVNEVWAFDPSSETWQQLEVVGDAPRLEFLRGATVDNKHYIVGGWRDDPDPTLVCKQVWNEDVYEVSLVDP
jgi:N-acetylneuraminic acid mutarotase